jgi:hypothetical protein
MRSISEAKHNFRFCCLGRWDLHNHGCVWDGKFGCGGALLLVDRHGH